MGASTETPTEANEAKRRLRASNNERSTTSEKTTLRGWTMIRNTVVGLALVGLAATLVAASSFSGSRWPDRVTAHEWGTFTTVAGEDGRAIEWLPLSGPTDLPCFVEHFQNSNTVKILPTEDARLIDYQTARSRLWGKVRMETPVLYFYGPRETALRVQVHFPRGLITEWYPHATANLMGVTSTALHDPRFSSMIEWPRVVVAPNSSRAFATEPGKSHYYAARATEASPLSVGNQSEKFLFYRGVANFDVPLSARVVAGDSLDIRNLGTEVIPNTVVFERRGSKVGYRIGGELKARATLAAPPLDASLESLRDDLYKMLIGAGLYPKEATAMLETWRDSWFEDGLRVFYIVPPKSVDAILPLSISPAPATTARVFVGRMEVLSSTVQNAVEKAITGHDSMTVERYGRFLGPIADRILAKNPGAAGAIRSATEKAFASYVKRASSCE
jgi:hypothetical protein